MAVCLLATALLFCAVEALVFHEGLYASIMAPGSSAGMLQSSLQHEKQRPLHGDNQVLAVGDSRMGAFLPKLANKYTGETGYTFATIATPGTTERCWYYMLREVDPDARRYAAIVIPAWDYEDEDWENMADRLLDLYFLFPILRISDAIEFSSTYPSRQNQWEAFRGILLKGWSYKRDFEDLLAHRKARMSEVRWNRRYGAKSVYDWVPEPHSLTGLTVDWKTRQAHFPDDSTPAQRQMIRDTLLRGTAPQTGLRAAYRRLWYGKIIQHYKGSRTRLIFIRLPRGPIVRPADGVKRSAVIREFAARGEVTLAEEHLFDELERPEFFGDALHMNGPGSKKFTDLAVKALVPILGTPRVASR